MLGCFGATGPVGACGPRSADEAKKWQSRPAWDTKDVSVSITFQCPNKTL